MINTGRPVATVARELGIKEQTLGRWVNVFKARPEAGDGSALSETERVELARLRKEVSELKMDRAFLKKSVALLRPGRHPLPRPARPRTHKARHGSRAGVAIPLRGPPPQLRLNLAGGPGKTTAPT